MKFRDVEAERVYAGAVSRRLPRDLQPAIRRKLRMVASATSLWDLRSPPSNRLEALKGARKGQYSIRVNDEWRICFRWQNGEAVNVEVVDYH